MISFLTYDGDKQEFLKIKTQVKELAGRLSEEKWEIQGFLKLLELKEYLSKEPLTDIMCYDVTRQEGLDYLEQVRSRYKEALLMVVADAGVSPMKYLRPAISPNSLLLRPASEQQIRAVLTETISSFMEQFVSGEGEDSFVIETREGKQYVPYSQIYYFEAREKKIFVRILDQEIGFYETMENLEERLPEYFLRCHRSYIINSKKIEKVMLSQNLVQLSSGLAAPLSRSYKRVLKDYKV